MQTITERLIQQDAPTIPAPEESTMKYRCRSDTYDQTGEPFDSVEDFLKMCREVFGEAPKLREQNDGCWYGTDGERVLEPVPE
jgi:hypothetical protein